MGPANQSRDSMTAMNWKMKRKKRKNGKERVLSTASELPTNRRISRRQSGNQRLYEVTRKLTMETCCVIDQGSDQFVGLLRYMDGSLHHRCLRLPSLYFVENSETSAPSILTLLSQRPKPPGNALVTNHVVQSQTLLT